MTGRVPVLPGLETATDDAQTVIDFAMNATLPIMIKAVDGGGGRGIRLVRDKADLSNAVTRAMRESPSGQVIVEKAAADGFHHIEVQIIGDGNGGVRHLWERECSIQRRYQKVIEIAPALFEDRKLIARVIDDAIKIAKQVSIATHGMRSLISTDHSRSRIFHSEHLSSWSIRLRTNIISWK